MKTSVPSIIHEKLQKWFGFPGNGIHVQVATSFDNQPHVRTMRLFDITENGHCIIHSHNKTLKWHELQNCPNIALLFINYELGQLTVEGTAQLKTEGSEVKQYWERMPDSIQRMFTSSPDEKIPETFGVISIKPLSWEMLELNQMDYNKSIRKKFVRDHESWKSHELTPR